MPEIRGSKGYALPEEVAPEGMICLKVFIPNDPLYLAAFGGAYERLGTWQAWEKDGTERASQAAQHWKNIIDYTRQNGWVGACGMSEECCEAIVNAINNLQLNVVVNVSGGGGGCSSPNNHWNLPSDWDSDLPTEAPEIPTETTEVPSGDLCDTAHQTHTRLYQFIDDYPELVNEASPYDELRDYILAIGFFVSPTAAVLYEAMASITGMAYGALERDTLDFWEEMKDDFICAVLTYDNAAALYNWLVEYITESAPNFFVRQWLLVIMQMPDWGLLYDGEYNIEAEFVGSDCAICASLGAPEPPEGYFWVVLDVSEFEYESHPNVEFDYDPLTGIFKATRTGGTTSERFVAPDASDILANNEASAIRGCYTRHISPPDWVGDGNSGLTYNNAVGGGSVQQWRLSDERRFRFDNSHYAEETGFANWIDSLPFATVPYGNGSMDDGKVRFGMEQNGAIAFTRTQVVYLLQE